MWHFVEQPELAAALVDFTSEFPRLTLGLSSLLALVLFAVLIAFVATQHRVPEETKPTAEVVTPTSHRDAA